MKICIIGAGITGLTLGKLLHDRHEVIIFEKQPYIGGIARTKKVDGVTYHLVGGHCFNSKNPTILDFVFNRVLSKDNWHKVERTAKIFFRGHFISYPIEYNVKEIAIFDEDLAYQIIIDFILAQQSITKPNNLAEWFEIKFGKTLALEYFIPYNKKIWKQDLTNMSYEWVKDKLPIPDIKGFLKSLIDSNKDNMPHREFYYPNSNDLNTFISALSTGLDIKTNFEVFSIENRNKKWIINNNLEFDIVINTSPLDKLPFLIRNTPETVLDAAKNLKYNKVTTMLFKSKPVKYTWTYYPSEEIIFHRCIHIGNFFKPNINYTIAEAIGEYSYKEMLEESKNISYLIELLDYNVSEHAYVVFDSNYKKSTTIIKEYLNKIGIYSVGRFGEWEYYNMDVCMEKAFDLVKKLQL